MAFIIHHAAILFFVLAMAAGLFIDRLLRSVDCDLRARHAARELRPFGYVSGMVGVGLLVGTQVVRQLAQRHERPTPARAVGAGGIGAGVLLLGAVPHIVATLAATFTIGFAFAPIMVPAQTLMQRETPPDMLGRVGSTNESFVFLGQILGLAVSGVLAEIVGVRAVFFLCAGLAAALVAGGRMLIADAPA